MIEHSVSGAGKRTAEGAYSFISEANKAAYLDTFLLSNQVLSKNPFTNNFLNHYVNNENSGSVSAFKILFKILHYYFKSFKSFMLYLTEFMIYYFNPVRFKLSTSEDELILVDTLFISEKIETSNDYTDPYFPGLNDVLDKKGKLYAYLPIFMGSKKILHLQWILKILKEKKVPVLCEYQLLSAGDILRLAYFITTYPFHVLMFANRLSTKNYELNLLKSELVDTLDSVTFNSFSRYLQGKKIARLPYKNIKVISWYENQVKDKGLYRGLREPSSKVKIYGAQLFLYSKTILNIIPDENEKILGIIPDKIIVNGPVFMPVKSRLNYHVGPSLRYANIFNRPVKKTKRDNILVLFSCFKSETNNIMRILSRLKNCPHPIHIKMHPVVSFEEIKHLVPANATIVKEDIYRLFETAKIIIGSGTGSLIEAASLGIPVIAIKNIQELNYNYLPEYGKGIIWDEAATLEDLVQKISKFDAIIDKNSEEITAIADKYKEMFFCNPTEENIIKTFDL